MRILICGTILVASVLAASCTTVVLPAARPIAAVHVHDGKSLEDWVVQDADTIRQTALLLREAEWSWRFLPPSLPFFTLDCRDSENKTIAILSLGGFHIWTDHACRKLSPADNGKLIDLLRKGKANAQQGAVPLPSAPAGPSDGAR